MFQSPDIRNPRSAKRQVILSTDVPKRNQIVKVSGVRALHISYVQLTNCKQAIPIQTSFGCFKVRIFGIQGSQETGHPFYRCIQKESNSKSFRCKSPSHLTKDFTNEVVCHYCMEKGHKKAECDEFVQKIIKCTAGMQVISVKGELQIWKKGGQDSLVMSENS